MKNNAITYFNKKNQRISFRYNYNDFRALYYSLIGMSTKFVILKTGLTKGMVQYRKKKANVRLSDYRDGRSEFAQYIVTKTEISLQRKIKKRIKQIE